MNESHAGQRSSLITYAEFSGEVRTYIHVPATNCASSHSDIRCRCWTNSYPPPSQGLVDLALCYYKHAEDPEVRGWVYLRDITEIAEEKDTMIISSTARTFHLYAETRAEHNRWVTGLVKLCPEAFVKLERAWMFHRWQQITCLLRNYRRSSENWSIQTASRHRHFIARVLLQFCDCQ